MSVLLLAAGAATALPRLPYELRAVSPLILGLVGTICIGVSKFVYEVRSLRLITALGAALSLALFLTQPTSHSGSLSWRPTVEAALAEKQAVTFVDLFAEWCGACKELDAETFSVPEVQARLSRLALARVDFTTGGEYSEAITQRFGVIGLPCLLFLDSTGAEIPDSRITGFLNPQEFLAHLDKVLTQAR